MTPSTFPKIIARLDKSDRAYVKAAGFEPRPGRAPDPAVKGPAACCSGWKASNEDHNAFLPGLLPGVLPAGIYRFANAPYDARLAALAFALGAYRFTRYRKAKDKAVRLVLPEGTDGDDLSRIVEGVTLGPRSDQHAGQRHGPGGPRGGGPRRSPNSTARNSVRSSATIC